ncbi:MAG: hypothetical protein IJ119_15780 [Clostridia bacterium]|nr:hypothetical protein [Clostridia bacterium]
MLKTINRILCICLALALLCGGMAFADAGVTVDLKTKSIDEIIAGMSLRDKLAQMMFFCPRQWKEDADSDAPAENIRVLNDYTRQYIADHRFGGILLYGENCGDAEQLLRLVADMQQANQEGGGLPMLMAVDQEGGNVSRLSFGTSGTGNMTIAATGKTENARAMGQVFGEELALLGLTTDFAPVVDVNDNAANPVIGVRAFSDDAGVVAKFGCAFMAGLQDTGTMVSLKHFPGHGNTDVDSHTGLPLVDRSFDELMANELVPYKAAIDAGADMVMTAHIQYPQLERQTYTSITTGEAVYIPATMSRAIMTDLLRGELGFEGVTVSDALEMKSIWDNYATDDILSMTINAGVDLLIMPAVRDKAMMEQIDDLLGRAVTLTEEGVIEAAQVDDSVRRILALKRKYGLLDKTDFTVTDAAVAAAVAGCGSAEHRQTTWNIACDALTLLKDENGAFPLDVKEGEKTLVLFTAASRAGAAEFSQKLLSEMGALPQGATLEGMTIEPDTADACMEAARAADHVLLVSRAWASDCLDPATENGFPVGVVNRVIDALHAAGKGAVVISCQLPYDAACYPGADAILLSYGSGPMKTMPPESGEGSAWVPDLPAAICAAFGAVQPRGKLPVSLPKLDEAYHLTDEILYARQVE